MTALTIAGFDPSSGAGITADLQVFAAHHVFGTSAITALTVQSTRGVFRTAPVAAAILRETLQALQDDLPPDGIKIGMLGSADAVREVIRYLRSTPASRVVLDPVIRSSSGAPLLDAEGLDLVRTELLPLVTVATPNVAELQLLTGTTCPEGTSQQKAAETLAAEHGCAIVITGGDLVQPVDRVYEDGQWTLLAGGHIRSNATHGTGCAFSSAMLCGLLHGESITAAAAAAKAYVANAILTARPRGHGKGPMNLLWPIVGHSRGR